MNASRTPNAPGFNTNDDFLLTTTGVAEHHFIFVSLFQNPGPTEQCHKG